MKKFRGQKKIVIINKTFIIYSINVTEKGWYDETSSQTIFFVGE